MIESPPQDTPGAVTWVDLSRQPRSPSGRLRRHWDQLRRYLFQLPMLIDQQLLLLGLSFLLVRFSKKLFPPRQLRL